MGLSELSRFTTSHPVQLHVYLEPFDAGDWAYAAYDSFQLADSSDRYRLTIAGYSGTAGDSLAALSTPSNGMQFSTRNEDNDRRLLESCASRFPGGWWYNDCHNANLNGQYLMGYHSPLGIGINWQSYRTLRYSLKTSVMKIRPQN